VINVLIIIYVTLFTQDIFAESEILQEKFHIGDFQKWKQKDFNDDNWRYISSGLPKQTGHYWVRIKLKISGEQLHQQQAIFTSILGAYDVYWDGMKLASNGVVATESKLEIPGSINFATPVPQHLWSEGIHIIALRISNFYAPTTLRQGYFNLRTGPHLETIQGYQGTTHTPLVILGGLILIGLFFFLLYFLYFKKTTYLLFSILCFTIASLLLVEVWKPLWGYSYNWHLFRLQLVEGLTFSIALLLPCFLLCHLQLAHKKWLFSGLLMILFSIVISIDGFDKISSLLMQVSLFGAFLITAYGCFYLRLKAWLIMGATLIVLMISLIFDVSFQDQYFFPSFTLIILSVLVELITDMKTVQLERNKAQLISGQLEIALLRKNIQPHFLLNTLTSIEQWIEESPQSAIEFIDALAEEFKLLNDISNKPLIRFDDEIRLCQAHIRIMGFRHDMKFELDCHNISANFLIPPAIIHTMIENSFSHNRYTTSPTIFKLAVEKEPEYYRVTYSSPIENPNKASSLETGTGNRYIKSRLDESFKGQWKMSSNEINGNWITSILIPNNLKIIT